MKRLTFSILTCLLFGVMTTVGVAWASAMFIKFPEFYDKRLRIETSDGLVTVIIYKGRTFAIATQFFGAGYALNEGTISHSLTQADDILPYWVDLRTLSGKVNMVRHDDARGWPMPALRCWFTVPAGSTFLTTGLTQGGISVRSGTPSAALKALPIYPVLPGFIVNTIGAASVLFLIHTLWSTNLRVRRKLRSACPRCAYTLYGGLDTGCPECGWNR